MFQPFVEQDFPMGWLTGFQWYFHGHLHFLLIFAAEKLPGERCPLKLDEHCLLDPLFCIKEGESKMAATRTSPSRSGCLRAMHHAINIELSINFQLTINFEFGINSN